MKLPPDVAILMTLRDSDPERRGMRVRALFRVARSEANADWFRLNSILALLQGKGLVATVEKDPFPVNKGVSRRFVITATGQQFLDGRSAKEAPRT